MVQPAEARTSGTPGTVRPEYESIDRDGAIK